MKQLDIPRSLYYKLLFNSKEHQEQALIEFNEFNQKLDDKNNNDLINKNISNYNILSHV